MLVVVGIIVILLVATLPALRGLNQSESRRGAVGNMMGALDHARMMAISDSLPTYVVFACKTSTGAQINADHWGRSYAIYQDSENAANPPVQKSPWMNLPTGMAFKVSADIAPSILTCYINNMSPQVTDPEFVLSKAVGDGSAQLPYWKFDNIGNVTVPGSVQTPQKPEDYLKVLLFPGYIDANGNEVVTHNVGSDTSQQKLQLEEIDVNPATGRAKYIIDPTNNLSTPSSTP